MKPDDKKPAPRRISPGFLLQLEEQRRQRRVDALQKRFEATLQHIDQVEQVNEEHYRRQVEMTDAAKTGKSYVPVPVPVAPPPRPILSPFRPRTYPVTSFIRPSGPRVPMPPAPPLPPPPPAASVKKPKKKRK